MDRNESLESELEKRYRRQDVKKIKRMAVSGKSVFQLKKTIVAKSKAKRD